MRFWLLVAIIPCFVLSALALTLYVERSEQRVPARLVAGDLTGDAFATSPSSHARTSELLLPPSAPPPTPPPPPSPPPPLLPPPLLGRQEAQPTAAAPTSKPISRSPEAATEDVAEDAAACGARRAADGAEELLTDVTLVTQASTERLWMVPYICTRWGGHMIVVSLRPAAGAERPGGVDAWWKNLTGSGGGGGSSSISREGLAVGSGSSSGDGRPCRLRRVEMSARPGDDEQMRCIHACMAQHTCMYPGWHVRVYACMRIRGRPQ